MSLDVYLELDESVSNNGSGIFVREDGSVKEISRTEWDKKFPGREPYIAGKPEQLSEGFSANITHNMTEMATEAGIYGCLWRPNENNIDKAHQLIMPLRIGLRLLKSNPEHYKQFNPDNGWGSYEGLISFVEDYLEACEEFPNANVTVWR